MVESSDREYLGRVADCGLVVARQTDSQTGMYELQMLGTIAQLDCRVSGSAEEPLVCCRQKERFSGIDPEPVQPSGSFDWRGD